MAFRTVELTGPAEIHVRNGALLVEKEIPNSKDVNKAGDTANTLTRGGNWSIVKPNEFYSMLRHSYQTHQ